MKVEIRKVLRGTTEEVFKAWTDPVSVRHWMCPDPFVRITQLDWTPVEGAEVRLVHDALPTSEAAAEHAAGWENTLARLGDYMRS